MSCRGAPPGATRKFCLQFPAYPVKSVVAGPAAQDPSPAVFRPRAGHSLRVTRNSSCQYLHSYTLSALMPDDAHLLRKRR